MKLEGKRVIAARRDEVWKCLVDSEVLRKCIPGCEELTGTPEEGFKAKVTQKIGPVKATFHGEVTLSDIVEGVSYRITGEGKGGAAGFAKGSALVMLNEVGDETELTYEVDSKIGGKIAQLGSRVIKGVANKLAGQFFDRFGTIVESSGDSVSHPD